MPLSGSFLTKVLVLEGALSPVLLALVQRDNELVGLSSDDLRLPKSPPIKNFSPEKARVIKVPSARSLGPFNQSGNGERAAWPQIRVELKPATEPLEGRAYERWLANGLLQFDDDDAIEDAHVTEVFVDPQKAFHLVTIVS